MSSLLWRGITSTPKSWCPALAAGRPIYIGQTANLSERFDDHNKMQCILAHSTRVLIHWNNGGEQARREEEDDLIKNYNPPCNG